MESEVFPQGLFVQCDAKTILFPLVLVLSNMISSNKTSCCIQKRAFMRTLLMRTALVRCNLKPAEIYQVPHCPCGDLPLLSPTAICPQFSEPLERLGLPWRALRRREGQSLVLFYNPELLANVLNDSSTKAYLASFWYPLSNDLPSWLDFLCRRFEQPGFPHEIGLFLGYPLKDVQGFMQPGVKPTYCGAWKIYGDLEPSLSRMKLFRKVTQAAEYIVDKVESWDLCVDKINRLTEDYKEYQTCLI